MGVATDCQVGRDLVILGSMHASPNKLSAPPRSRRRDLDGLRGLAIGLVVVFHVWFGRVSGGVDVFLVVSGFVFTTMVVKRSADRHWVPNVLTRTLRRLLPAMLVVLAAVAIGHALWLPDADSGRTWGQIIASITYHQNSELAGMLAGYRPADPSVSPLQHLWSMSIQGQFYLFLIVLVACVAAWTRRHALPRVAGTLLVVLGFASFAYAMVATRLDQAAAYYSTFARAWELLAGAVLALVIDRIRLPRRQRALLAAIGIVGVLSCGLVLDGAAVFPGPATLWPVGATLLLIVAGSGGDEPVVTRLLGAAPLVWLGGIAYALYLWHWPVLIFTLAARKSPAVGVATGCAVIAASIVLAWLTARYVEDPLRAPGKVGEQPVRIVHRAAGAVCVATAVAVLGMLWLPLHAEQPRRMLVLDPARYPGAAHLVEGADVPAADMRPTVFEAVDDLPAPFRDGCITGWDDRPVVTCTYGDPDADRTIAVVGSSHAEHWVTAMGALGAEHGFRVVVYLKMGCPLTIVPGIYGSPYCSEWSQEVVEILGHTRPDWIFTTSTRPRLGGIGDETPPDVVETWAALSAHDIPIIGIRDTPWLRRDGILYRATDCLREGGNAESCGVPRDEVLDPLDPAAAAAVEFPLVHPIDLSDAVCDGPICRVVEGNVLIYHDEHHLTASYVRTLTPVLGKQVGAVTGWW